MEVNPTSGYSQNTAQVAASSNNNSQTENTTENTQTNATETPAAVYEPSNEKKNYKVDRNQISTLLKESQRQTDNFRRLIESLISKQSEKNALANGTNKKSEYKGLLNDIYNGNNAYVEVDAATRAQAQQEISEDGYYGVKQTSERILEFAKAISGGDPSKIESLRAAVEEGFKAAESVWGGKLPQISQDTYDAVMKGFDDWADSTKKNA